MIPATVAAQGSRFPRLPDVSPPLVFVVDEDVDVRESLELMIQSAGWQPAAFASAHEFLAHPRAQVPTCLVLDVVLPDMYGLDLQERVVSDRRNTSVIFLASHADVPMTVRAMKHGAVDFLTKPFRDDVILAAMTHAIELSRVALVREADSCALRERHTSLTRREREVMALVVTGQLNKQVADDLGISEITVKAHRGTMMRKMKASSLPALVNMAATLGIGAHAER